MKKPMVIAISAVSGGGKTTVTNQLKKYYLHQKLFILMIMILRDMINQPSNLLKDDLNCYLSRGRIAYLEMIKTIKPNSDFIVDGSLSVDNIVSQIIEQILK